MISLFPPWRGEKTKVMHIPLATVLQRIESKLLAANWKAGRRTGPMLLETAQQPFETGLD
jgi:hypothetical protein